MIRIACCCAGGQFVAPLPGFCWSSQRRIGESAPSRCRLDLLRRPAVLGWRCAPVRAPSGGPSYFLDFGELGTALPSQSLILAEDSGEIGQERIVTLPGRLVITRCGGPARHRASGPQGGQVRPAEDLGAVVRQASAEISGSLRVT